MRNDLLEQVVIASGGTVTNKGDRNALLSDWLTAVESSQAEVARLDGATKYWELSQQIAIPENIDFKLTFDINGKSTSLEGLVEGVDLFFRFLTESDSTFFNENAQMSIAGKAFALLTLANGYTRDGTLKKISVFRQGGDIYSKINKENFRLDSSGKAGGFTISNLGKHVNSYFAGYISNFEVEINGVITNSIAMTNKEQGATQLATVGSINATMINYTGDEWEPLP